MGKRKNRNYFTDYEIYSEYLNDRTFIDYYTRLKNIAINMFEWKGLPEFIAKKQIGVSERFLETLLFEYGHCLYFRDEYIGDIVQPATIASRLNIYDEPIRRFAYSNNGCSWVRDYNDSVLIYNNYAHYPTKLTIQMYASRLADIERSIDINLANQKTPYAWEVEETQKQTVKTAYDKKQRNEPYLIFDKKSSLFDKEINKIDLTVPYVSDKLYEMKQNTLQEVYEFLGVVTSRYEKAERKNESEIMSENGMAIANRYIMLNSRREGAKHISKMFGTDIEVNFRQQLVTFDNFGESTTEYPPLYKGGDDDVKIYN